MKGILIVCMALTAVVAVDQHEAHSDYVVKTEEDLARFRQHCISHLNIPADLVEKYKKWEFPDDEKTRCYMECIFEQFGIFDAQHGFDVHKIHHQLVGAGSHVDHTDETHQKIERCADKNTERSDACTWAYRGGICFLRENLQLVQQSVKSR